MSKNSTLLAKITFIFFIFSFINLSAQNSIYGIILDSINNKPVSSVKITSKSDKNLTVQTDQNGNFILNNINVFPIDFKIQKSGFEVIQYSLKENPSDTLIIKLLPNDFVITEVIVTARRREETAQEVPIPINVISGKKAEETGAFNVNRLKELVPSVQFYSSTPRNTSLSIRGLGSTFGLTNDGLDPGVGFYVDGVYYARPAATTLDFVDIERIEVLRGPQGTLFGKNTTAGTFNVTTKQPSFTTGGTAEISFGNYGFIQAKTSVTGAISEKFANRFSASGTHRDGTIYNSRTSQNLNDINSIALRDQLLYKPNENLKFILTGDYNRLRANGYAQVIAGVVTTKRAAYRQFNNIISDLGYTLPAIDPFNRTVDTDTPWKAEQDMGGLSLNAEYNLGKGKIVSTSAWRFWNWNPSNDRDFTGLSALAKSQAPSKHQQWSQEIRWSGNFNEKLSGVFGVFGIWQRLRADKNGQIEEAGKDQWRFSLNSTNAAVINQWKTPGLLEGYGIKSYPSLNSFSGAVFGQLDWNFTDKFSLLPGVRINYDKKEIDFKRITYGGLQTNDPALIAIKNSVYSNQEFNASIDDTNFSGQLTLAFKPTKNYNLFGTFSTGFKPVGLNLGGLPTNPDGTAMTELAVIKPERILHYELGLKSQPFKNFIFNLTLYNSAIKDYQVQVQAADLSINRGYLANAEKVRVRGVETDLSYTFSNLYFYSNLAYTEAIYKKFTNAPPALEDTGGPTFIDISGGVLPGVSKWAGSTGGEINFSGKFLNYNGDYFFALDSYYRSTFSSSPTPSKFLNIPGYALFNSRFGFRVRQGVTAYVWVRNILNRDYFEQLLPGAGNAGHYAAVLGDPRTFGVTIKYNF
ncbi:TonB-dependent receptor [Epilithonimonas sp. UC225_85]|uniref:TonB-dependent receptor n=1 Tax=Epilithonimonas sp. UC225_85 TaxID=3350167 RepID=UPI0036D3A0EE